MCRRRSVCAARKVQHRDPGSLRPSRRRHRPRRGRRPGHLRVRRPDAGRGRGRGAGPADHRRHRAGPGRLDRLAGPANNLPAGSDVTDGQRAALAKAQINLLVQQAVWQRVADDHGRDRHRRRRRQGAQQPGRAGPELAGRPRSSPAATTRRWRWPTPSRSRTPRAWRPARVPAYTHIQALVTAVVDDQAAKLHVNPNDQNSLPALQGAILPMLVQGRERDQREDLAALRQLRPVDPADRRGEDLVDPADQGPDRRRGRCSAAAVAVTAPRGGRAVTDLTDVTWRRLRKPRSAPRSCGRPSSAPSSAPGSPGRSSSPCRTRPGPGPCAGPRGRAGPGRWRR